MALNLDLSAQLMRNIIFEQLALEEDLERDNKFGFLLSGKVHMPELTSTKRSSNFKVVNRPICAIKLLGFGRRVSSWRRYTLFGKTKS